MISTCSSFCSLSPSDRAAEGTASSFLAQSGQYLHTDGDSERPALMGGIAACWGGAGMAPCPFLLCGTSCRYTRPRI